MFFCNMLGQKNAAIDLGVVPGVEVETRARTFFTTTNLKTIFYTLRGTNSCFDYLLV